MWGIGQHIVDSFISCLPASAPAALPLSKVTISPFHSQRQRAQLRKKQKARYFVINAINNAKGA
ncbi:hypothetical protein CJ196_10230 [Bifidobacterium breve]|jgi:hypothetical protein|uniref:Transposase n=1 Tax=Bifidobacterium breve TaxID=1685 RepID=A0AAW7LL29_BIFBR|nr:hypothetical protein BBL520_10495 [Bifidobacterium breve]AZI17456.1 hypothetical protein EH245_10130 [Bifidobacterium breve]MBD9020520.1 hypothetical protein [Bifidobacterium breve]MDN4188205.1 hypothetical protein [Bifidobacterium breve]PKY89426.1 hypothetical protein CYJ38_04595 [Bifidobacterium breve]